MHLYYIFRLNYSILQTDFLNLVETWKIHKNNINSVLLLFTCLMLVIEVHILNEMSADARQIVRIYTQIHVAGIIWTRSPSPKAE